MLPNDLIARTLNARSRRVGRGRFQEDIPRLHVSSLIKSNSDDFFCPREFVLNFMERREAEGGGLPPKFELLYELGHFYGNYIVKRFLERNPEYGQYAWGDWSCDCGGLRLEKCTKPEGMICNRCGTKVHNYVETDLLDPKGRLVGHADLIFLYKGVFYVYEFKSIERADVPFDTIKAPLGDHLLQASFYYHMLKAAGHKVSPIIRVVYVDRSMTGLYTVLPFKEVYGRAIPMDRLKRLYKRVTVCHKSIAERKLPTRKCKEIGCSRAKQCNVAISCFNRNERKVFRIPSDLTPASPPLVSTSDQLTEKVNGTASQSQAKKVKRRLTRTASSRSTKKSLKQSKT